MTIKSVTMRIIAGLILLSVTAIAASSTSSAESPANQKQVDYRIGKSFRTVSGPPALVVHISIDPKNFNRGDMILLARELNEKFHDEERLSVWIFDSNRAAKRFVPLPNSPTYERDLRSFRGYYSLDRTSGKEYIEFSSSPDKPRNEITVSLAGN